MSERTGLDRGVKGGNCGCRYQIAVVRETREFDDIGIRKKEIRKAKLRKDIQNREKGGRVLLGCGMVVAFDKSEGNSGICDEQIGDGERVRWSKAILP